MTRKLGVAAIGVVLCTCASPSTTRGQQQEQNRSNAPRKYSMAEYNDLTLATRQDGAAERIRSLDSFVAKYVDSPLLPCAYQAYYEAYEKVSNFPKVMEYAEKRLETSSPEYPDSMDANERLEATFAWARAYKKLHSDDAELAAKAHEIVRTGLALLASFKRPNHLDEKTFTLEMQRAASYLNVTGAVAALAMKDYKAASESLEALSGLTSYDPSELREAPVPHAL
jgi:hypothetical protein